MWRGIILIRLFFVSLLISFCSLTQASANDQAGFDNRLGVAWFGAYPGYFQDTGYYGYYDGYYWEPSRIHLDYSSKIASNKYRVWEIGFSALSRNSENPVFEYNSEKSAYEDTVEKFKYVSYSANIGIGTRKYMEKRGKLSPFIQYSGKFSVGYRYENNYFGFDVDKKENESKGISAGVGLSGMYGIEYYFTDQMSVSVHYEVVGLYARGRIRAPGDSSVFAINDSSGLRFGWHW